MRERHHLLVGGFLLKAVDESSGPGVAVPLGCGDAEAELVGAADGDGVVFAVGLRLDP